MGHPVFHRYLEIRFGAVEFGLAWLSSVGMGEFSLVWLSLVGCSGFLFGLVILNESTIVDT